MKLRHILPLAFSLFGAHAAWSADSGPSWYAGASIGSNSTGDQYFARDISVGTIVFPSQTMIADMDSGASYSIVAGYNFTPSISLEGEYTHRNNKSQKIHSVGSQLAIQDNFEVGNDSLLVNALYTFRELGMVQPYFGAGLGPVRMKASWTDSLGSDTDAGWTVGYQVLFGADLKLGDRWSLYGQYQNLTVPNTAVAPTTTKGNSQIRVSFNDYQAQTLSLGVRFRF